ncbi:MAG TPA: hypothetical protein VFZ25_16955 [Chloroflexota bacterium]|nr:hypothetical protein [Chloroflexota bacterium]
MLPRGEQRRANPRRRSMVLPRSIPGGPQATELASALHANNRERALGVLLQANADGWEMRDIEEVIIAPAVSRLGELWLRGRIDDSAFERIGGLAETVEITYRRLVLQPVGHRESPRELVARPR